MNKDMTGKQVAIGLVIMLSIAAGGAFAYNNNSSSGSEAWPEQQVPDGYVKTDSTTRGDEIIHEFEKPAPEQAKAKQTPDQTFARYMDALPKPQQIMGIEFKSLYISLQNAKLAADVSGLLARAKDNEAKIAEFETRESDQKLKGSQGDDVHVQTVVPASEPAESFNASNLVNTNTGVIDKVLLSGIYLKKLDDTAFYVALIGLNGQTVSAVEGQVLPGGITVGDVSRRAITLSSEDQTRTLTLTGSL